MAVGFASVQNPKFMINIWFNKYYMSNAYKTTVIHTFFVFGTITIFKRHLKTFIIICMPDLMRSPNPTNKY